MDKGPKQTKVQKMNVYLVCKLDEYERKDMYLTPGGLVDVNNHSRKRLTTRSQPKS